MNRKIPVSLYKKIVDKMPILCVDMIVRHKGKFLLVKRKNEPLKGKFWVPGGRILKGENLEAAVTRKAKEELGIDVKIVKFVGVFNKVFYKNKYGSKTGFHGLSVVFLVEPLSLKIKLDGQSSDWKLSKDIPKLLKVYKIK